MNRAQRRALEKRERKLRKLNEHSRHSGNRAFIRVEQELKQEMMEENWRSDNNYLEQEKSKSIHLYDNLYIRTEKLNPETLGSCCHLPFNRFVEEPEHISVMMLEDGLEDIDIFHELEHYDITQLLRQEMGASLYLLKQTQMVEFASSHGTPSHIFDSEYDSQKWGNIVLNMSKQFKRKIHNWLNKVHFYWHFNCPEIYRILG